MNVNQIYSIVNSVNSQAMGATALTVVDEQGLIALGNTVLSSSTHTENFLNTLVMRIGKTIFSFRKYTSMFNDYLRDDFEWGAILQKIKVSMPVAEADQSFDLTNGQSVDMYKINKPVVNQKLFITETPWQIHVSISRNQLKEAFTSASAMGGLINYVFGEVQNAIELTFETLGHNALTNMIAETKGTARAINLIKLYKDETGTTLTPASAYHNADFLRFAVGKIKEISSRMRTMSKLWNDGTLERHTPYENQDLFIATKLNTALETVVQYNAFNKEYVSLVNYKDIPYWQSSQTPEGINVKKASTGTAVTASNIVAVICDHEAWGLCKNDEWISTTPFNSAGGYANTYYHFKKMFFNDLSENFVYFYLEAVTA